MKKKIIILISGLLMVVVAIICGFSYFNMELISDKVVTELGIPVNQTVSDYAIGNISNAELDLTNVNIQKSGTYKASVSNMTRKLNFQVEVVDTLPPVADSLVGLSFWTNTPVKASDLVTNIVDNSPVKVTFSNGKESNIYLKGGKISDELLLTDESGNQSKLTVEFQVIADTVKPQLIGIKAITVYIGDKISYIDGISATDDRDGDITTNIKIDTSKVNLNKPGEYQVVYSVSDNSNNKTIKKTSVTVLKDKAPAFHGIGDKTVYLNTKINYLNGVTAKDDREGDLSSNIIVDSSQVNITKTGTYKVKYSVSDSNGNTTKATISITIKKKESVQTENKKSPKKEEKTTIKKDKDSKSDNSSGFQFFDVKPSGKQPNGDVPAGGKQDVGNWG